MRGAFWGGTTRPAHPPGGAGRGRRGGAPALRPRREARCPAVRPGRVDGPPEGERGPRDADELLRRHEGNREPCPAPPPRSGAARGPARVGRAPPPPGPPAPGGPAG